VGAVQKLATVVMIGLVALATALVVYLADEPNRRDGQAGTQDHLAIERGTELYITYCLQCHGPAGLGNQGGEEPPRVGAVLNQAPFANRELPVRYQSDNPAEQGLAREFINYRLQYGVPEDPRSDEIVRMPAFGEELNVEEKNDIIYLIMNGDWNYVYNEALLYTGQTAAEAECDATKDAEACELAEHPEPVYPTVPATPIPDDEAQAAGEDPGAADSGSAADPSAGGASPAAGGASPAAGGAQTGGAAASGQVLEALDPADWSEKELTLAPGDTIQVVNAGLGQHDFTVDALGIAEELSAEPVTITIPDDAEPGTYEFYCSVPGHKEQGMVGTLTVT